MPSYQGTSTGKPSAVTFVQILFYLAAILNVVNGIVSFSSDGMMKRTLCVLMITFGVASVYIASRLNRPDPTHRSAAILLSGILIVLRIVEYFVWSNMGFLLGVILPIIIIWRLNGTEARAWFRS